MCPNCKAAVLLPHAGVMTETLARCSLIGVGRCRRLLQTAELPEPAVKRCKTRPFALYLGIPKHICSQTWTGDPGNKEMVLALASWVCRCMFWIQGIVAPGVTELHVYCSYTLWLGRRINMSTVVLWIKIVKALPQIRVFGGGGGVSRGLIVNVFKVFHSVVYFVEVNGQTRCWNDRSQKVVCCDCGSAGVMLMFFQNLPNTSKREGKIKTLGETGKEEGILMEGKKKVSLFREIGR